MVVSVSDPFFVKSDRLLVLQLSFHFRCMWEYTTSAHGLPIGAFFRGESARNAYRRNEDYSITKRSSTVVLGERAPVSDAFRPLAFASRTLLHPLGTSSRSAYWRRSP